MWVDSFLHPTVKQDLYSVNILIVIGGWQISMIRVEASVTQRIFLIMDPSMRLSSRPVNHPLAPKHLATSKSSSNLHWIKLEKSVYLRSLVVRGSDKMSAVRGEVHGSHSTCMPFHCHRFSLPVRGKRKKVCLSEERLVSVVMTAPFSEPI